MLHTVLLEYANSVDWLLDGQVASILVSRLLTDKLHDLSPVPSPSKPKKKSLTEKVREATCFW